MCSLSLSLCLCRVSDDYSENGALAASGSVFVLLLSENRVEHAVPVALESGVEIRSLAG